MLGAIGAACSKHALAAAVFVAAAVGAWESRQTAGPHCRLLGVHRPGAIRSTDTR
jgi:hypothetical protein